jgi:hypothetical protein
MIPVGNVPGIMGGWIKENDGGYKFMYNIYDTL